VLTALLLVGAMVAAAWWFVLRTPTYAVPALVGQPAEAALSVAVEHDWQLEATEQYADGTVAGQILGQDPEPGIELEEGGLLRVTVSLGPPPVVVPTDLAGVPLAEAAARLEAVGLTAGEPTRRFDEAVAKDVVIGLGEGVPAELPKGSAVPLVVSDGPAPRTIPAGLAGIAAEDAVAQLEALGLVPVTEGYAQFSDTVPEGQSMGTDPGPGTQVPKGAEVIVIVSKGPPVVVVADVAGASVVDAAAELEAQGLVVSDTRGSPRQPVVRTEPAAGTEVRVGSSITIITGSAGDDD
jgi:serine/threonine-protein kinase